jgi:hypothetical protein
LPSRLADSMLRTLSVSVAVYAFALTWSGGLPLVRVAAFTDRFPPYQATTVLVHTAGCVPGIPFAYDASLQHACRTLSLQAMLWMSHLADCMHYDASQNAGLQYFR